MQQCSNDSFQHAAMTAARTSKRYGVVVRIRCLACTVMRHVCVVNLSRSHAAFQGQWRQLAMAGAIGHM